jgi:hypothetical protein
MKLQIRYIRESENPFENNGFSNIQFYEINPEESLDLNAIITALNAPINAEDITLQVSSNQYYLQTDMPLKIQLEQNGVHDYR